jgi:hypothetical protein
MFYDVLIREWAVSGTTLPPEDNLRKALSNTTSLSICSGMPD